MMTNETRSGLPAPSPRGPMIWVFLLLGLAAVAHIGPWRVDSSAGRIALGVATVCIIGAFGTATWIVGGLARPEADGHSPTPTDWRSLLDRLDRIAVALESPPTPPVLERGEPSGRDHLEVADAIAGGRWKDADALLGGLEGDPHASRLADDLATAKRAAEAQLAGELKAAQDVGDPDRVLEIHAGLGALLPPVEAKQLDGTLAKWFLSLIMKRLRTGTVRADVAELAATVAGRFAQTVEGASLRASLPTLRRSAGLCPRCARPYRGIADACPICLAAPPSPPTVAMDDDTSAPAGPLHNPTSGASPDEV